MVLDRVNSGTRGGNATTLGAGYHGKRIQAGLSTQIVIQVADDTAGIGKKYVIGAIQRLEIRQSRPLAEMKEVGTDGLISVVPNGATTYNISLERVVFDFQRLPQALQREYRNIHAQRRPFDIVITDYNPYLGKGINNSGTTTESETEGREVSVDTASGQLSTGNQSRETILKNCWFSDLNFTYAADNFLITESATLKCEHIYDSDEVQTVAGPVDKLERVTNKSETASVMSAYDAKVEP